MIGFVVISPNKATVMPSPSTMQVAEMLSVPIAYRHGCGSGFTEHETRNQAFDAQGMDRNVRAFLLLVRAVSGHTEIMPGRLKKPPRIGIHCATRCAIALEGVVSVSTIAGFVLPR